MTASLPPSIVAEGRERVWIRHVQVLTYSVLGSGGKAHPARSTGTHARRRRAATGAVPDRGRLGFFILEAKPSVASDVGTYSLPQLKDATAALSGSGGLINGGHHAQVPLASVAHARKIWVRNGLGQLRKAAVESRFKKDGMALLKLDQSLPLTDGFMAAGRDPFPGSIVCAIEYAMVRGTQPDWPVLRHGFLGNPVGNGPDWKLGIKMPNGPHGGPVFDASGSLVRVSITTPHGKPMFLPISRIRRALGEHLGPVAPAMNGTRMAMEQVYENAMGATVQVLTAR